MSENQKKSVFELPKMVTDDPKGNFEVMLNLVYGKDGRSYIRYSEDGTDGMPITDFCFKKLCPEFGCPAVVSLITSLLQRYTRRSADMGIYATGCGSMRTRWKFRRRKTKEKLIYSMVIDYEQNTKMSLLRRQNDTSYFVS